MRTVLDSSGPNSCGSLHAGVAGALAGLATFVISAPTELVKCRAQLDKAGRPSWNIAKDIWRRHGLTGLYYGGLVTSVRDSVGYGF